MTLCNKLFKNARWVFSPATLLKYVRDCCAFRSPFHPLDTEVQSWRSTLLKWRGLCSYSPPCSSRSSAESARGSGAGFCGVSGSDVGASVALTANRFALGPVAETLLRACHPADASRTMLVGKDDDLHINLVSVSPSFAMLVWRVVGKRYLPVKWRVGYFYPGCFCVGAQAALEGSWHMVIVASQAHEKAQLALKMHFRNGLKVRTFRVLAWIVSNVSVYVWVSQTFSL